MKLDEKLQMLEEKKEQHLKVAITMMKTDDAAIYPMDFIAMSVIKRSMSLIGGFITMIRNENFICAAPLVRLQLDNALRFYATTLVKDPNAVAIAFIKGTPIKEYRDHKTNKKLYDWFLVDSLSKYYPWIKSVYEHTSGYIHLSEKHFFNVSGIKNVEERTIEFVSGEKDHFISEEERIEATEAMTHITELVLTLLQSWTNTKENPCPDQWLKEHS